MTASFKREQAFVGLKALQWPKVPVYLNGGLSDVIMFTNKRHQVESDQMAVIQNLLFALTLGSRDR